MNINKMNTRILFNKYLIPLLVIVLIQGIYYFGLGLSHAPIDAHETPDSASYVNVMHTLYGHYKPDEIRTIGYPLLLYLMKQVSSFAPWHFYQSVFVIQLIMLLLIIFIWMRIATKLTGLNSVWITIVLCMNPTFMIYAYSISTETFFLFFISLGFYAVHNFFLKQNLISISLGVSSFCFATLIRPGFYYFNLLFCLLILLLSLVKWKKLSHAVSIGCIYSLFIFSHQVAFFQKYQAFKLSHIDVITQYRYLTNQIQCVSHAKSLLENLKTLDATVSSLPSHNQHKYMLNINHENLHANYGHTGIALLKTMLSNFHTGNTNYKSEEQNIFQRRYFDITRIFNMGFCLALILAHIVCLFAWRKRLFVSPIIYLIIMFADYSFVTSCMSFWQGDRFNMVWFMAITVALFFFYKLFFRVSTHHAGNILRPNIILR